MLINPQPDANLFFPFSKLHLRPQLYSNAQETKKRKSSDLDA